MHTSKRIEICSFVPSLLIPSEPEPIWAASAFWIIDRAVRWLKLLLVNTGKSVPVQAVPEHVADHAIRLTLPNRRIWWSPGQHVFLTLPGVSKMPFESHPFTIASIRDDKNQDLVFTIRVMDGFTRRLHKHAVGNPGKPVMVLVDGPYGTPPAVNTFSTVVLLAGKFQRLSFDYY
jgi:ferric-chelate reductase